jgi:hypothetical protein
MTGIELIAAERQRQIDVEGWTPEHDDMHDEGQLTGAAECYAARAADQLAGIKSGLTDPPLQWTFEDSWWKPSPDPERNLVKAGALIAAELDKLRRRKENRDGDQAGTGQG